MNYLETSGGHFARLGFLLVGLSLVTGCAGGFGSGLLDFGRSKPAPSDGPGSLQLVTSGKAEQPRNLPKSRYGNPQTYEVFGKQYRVMDSAEGYAERGGASWYGSKFHGRKTSSGEIYNMYDMTAAHRSLPLPTFVEVTNLENGRMLVVKVNDRGPFHSERIIDLSFAAASKLGILENGTADVEVRAISVNDSNGGPAQQIAYASDSMPEAGAGPQQREIPASYRQTQDTYGIEDGSVIVFQVGAYSERDNAEVMRSRVNEAMQIKAAYIEDVADRGLFRVRFGVASNVPESAVARHLQSVGIDKYSIVAQ